MTTNPLINALAGSAYVSLVASFMFYGKELFGPTESIFMPMGMLSLFVLSASIMSYLFCYEPVRLLFEERAKEAAKLFLSTIAIFACITLLALVAGILVSS